MNGYNLHLEFQDHKINEIWRIVQPMAQVYFDWFKFNETSFKEDYYNNETYHIVLVMPIEFPK